MIKEKKCQGNGKAIGFGCGELVPVQKYGKSNRVYGLGLSCGCYPKWLYSSKEGLEIVNKATLKATEPRRKFKEFKEEHKEAKSLPSLILNTVFSVHQFIKERDKGKPCISCGKPWHKSFQAGHYFKAELYSHLKFHYLNIHGQCAYCNTRLEGNLGEYSKRLPDRIGEESFRHLVFLSEGSKKDSWFKWNREALKQIKNKSKIDFDNLIKSKKMNR